MKEYIKPLPVVQPWSRAFWEAAKQHKLTIQKCGDCETLIFFPRKKCPSCWSEKLGWIEASGKAKVFSYTVTYGGTEEKFAPDLPYVLAWVDLEEGVRMLTNIVECDPEEVKIGMDVEVIFKDITLEFSLPKFKPIEGKSTI